MISSFGSFAYRNGELGVGDLRLRDLAKDYGTPLYAYDLTAIERNFRELDRCIKVPHGIAYAVKANANLSLLKFLADLGAGFDIVSGGELFKVIKAGGNPGKIIFSGVGKTASEIRQALAKKVGYIAAESLAEIEFIEKIAAELGQPAMVLLRLNPEIDPQTHPYIATGVKESKFGIPSRQAIELMQHFANSIHLRIIGFSVHIGSQITDEGPFISLAGFVKRKIEEFRAAKIEVGVVSVGGGLGISYRDEAPITYERYAEIINAAVPESIELILEPGRSLVGNCGVLLTQVLYHKGYGDKQFRILDAGMNDLIRPALYQAHHEIVPLTEVSQSQSVVDWVGPVCESSDAFARKRLSFDVKVGEIVAIMSAGAYGFSMASNYNARCRPAEVAIYKGKHWLIRNRETYEDLIRGEIISSGAV